MCSLCARSLPQTPVSDSAGVAVNLPDMPHIYINIKGKDNDFVISPEDMKKRTLSVSADQTPRLPRVTFVNKGGWVSQNATWGWV